MATSSRFQLSPSVEIGIESILSGSIKARLFLSSSCLINITFYKNKKTHQCPGYLNLKSDP